MKDVKVLVSSCAGHTNVCQCRMHRACKSEVINT